ncbi:MAG: hypothetical protein U9N48_06840 [Euryarchaeota archaeon]|nr:hypothetical protein [Euryarchaeota archaeon]
MILLALLLSVVALAQTPGDENGTDQVETTEAAKTNWLERNGTIIGVVAALLAIIAHLSGIVSRIKKIILAKLGKKPPENTSPPQQISTENRTTTASGERSKAIGGDVSNSTIADTIVLPPEALESLSQRSTVPPFKISNIPYPRKSEPLGTMHVLIKRLHNDWASRKSEPLGTIVQQVEGLKFIKVYLQPKREEHMRKLIDLHSQQISDLENSMYEDLKLIKEYNEKLRYEEDPRKRREIKLVIKQIEDDLELKRTKSIKLIDEFETMPESFTQQIRG